MTAENILYTIVRDDLTKTPRARIATFQLHYNYLYRNSNTCPNPTPNPKPKPKPILIPKSSFPVRTRTNVERGTPTQTKKRQ